MSKPHKWNIGDEIDVDVSVRRAQDPRYPHVHVPKYELMTVTELNDSSEPCRAQRKDCSFCSLLGRKIRIPQ
jgi:hypothetical protein